MKALKSDHAKPAAVPRVSLEFLHSGARYLVERSPPTPPSGPGGREPPRRRPRWRLYRLVGTEREVIVSRTTEVNREVEDLVGLNARQFRQVILLPQGKFAKVLQAKADEREALLKTQFDTVVFERAGYWLEDKAKSARGEVAEQNRAQEVLRNQAAHEWSPYAPSPEQGEAADDEKETQAGETVPTHQAGLDRLVEQIGGVVVRTESTLQQTTAALKTAQKAKAEIDKMRTAGIGGRKPRQSSKYWNRSGIRIEVLSCSWPRPCKPRPCATAWMPTDRARVALSAAGPHQDAAAGRDRCQGRCRPCRFRWSCSTCSLLQLGRPGARRPATWRRDGRK